MGIDRPPPTETDDDAIAESFPPQCGGERIRVEGLNFDLVPGLQTEGDVSWAERVTLFGSVE